MKKFTNYTNKEFTCSWDGKEYTFLPNESRILDDGIAETFAKHLANLNFNGTLVVNDIAFQNEMAKALSEATIPDEETIESIAQSVITEKDEEPEIIEKTFEVEVEVEEKETKPKKTTKKTTKAKGRKPKVAKDAEDFEGLQK